MLVEAPEAADAALEVTVPAAEQVAAAVAATLVPKPRTVQV